MAKLEVQIGADSSELNAEIIAAEEKIKRLSEQKVKRVKLGLDTSEISKDIADAKVQLDGLKKSLQSTGKAFDSAAPKVANAGNTLTNFGRIAQDAPFGIMGIGNNITATAEAFASLSKQSGGAGAALKAVGASLVGPGGILLAVSLVTTALTVMSQKGITVSDVFAKMSGSFDQFKKDLQEVNKEAAKNSAVQVQEVKAYASAAQDIKLSMQERLIAVKKLQDEYPAYFGNLTKEQILNGNISNAVKEVTEALKAKARAQAYANKLGELASKEVELRDLEAKKIEESEALVKKISEEKKKGEGFSLFGDQLDIAKTSLKSVKAQLLDIRKDISDNAIEMDKWAAKSNIEVKASIKLEYKEDKLPKPKKIKEKRFKKEIDPAAIMADELEAAKALIRPDEFVANLGLIVPAVDEKFKEMLASMKAFNDEAKSIITDNIAQTFGQLGTSIGEALVSGGNVLSAIGSTILQSLGNFLSDMGGMLIKYGTLAVAKGVLDTAILAGGPLSVAAGVAAIGVGVALKAAGGAIGGMAKKSVTGGGNISAGNSVSSPSTTVTRSTTSSGLEHVVFEISGSSLIGVLNNATTRNSRIGG